MRDKIRKAKLPHAIEVSMVLRTLRDMRGEDGYIDLNNLEEREQIGTGGFGSVFLCDYHSGGKSTPVAVKQLHHALLSDPEQTRRFLAEANLVRKLRHRWVVPAARPDPHAVIIFANHATSTLPLLIVDDCASPWLVLHHAAHPWPHQLHRGLHRNGNGMP